MKKFPYCKVLVHRGLGGDENEEGTLEDDYTEESDADTGAKN